jgi:uncharacterized protein YqjF (DUF2071 family)
MFHTLRRHPFPVVAHFERCLVLTYALPPDSLRPLLPPGLELDTFAPGEGEDEIGFLAIALVQTRGLRPLGVPRVFGRDFFLSGYRIFTRFRTPAGRRLRGLRILRSDTDRRQMARAGNLLTHYNYRLAEVELTAVGEQLTIRTCTPGGEADLDVTADLSGAAAILPPDSCFTTERDARRFAGPLPYTFDYERETHSIIAIRGRRRDWHPRLVTASVRQATFFNRPPFARIVPRLASAFFVADIPYRWDRGIRHALPRTN